MGVNGSPKPGAFNCHVFVSWRLYRQISPNRIPPLPKTGLFGQTQKDAAESKRGDVRLVWELLAAVRGLLALPK